MDANAVCDGAFMDKSISVSASATLLRVRRLVRPFDVEECLSLSFLDFLVFARSSDSVSFSFGRFDLGVEPFFLSTPAKYSLMRSGALLKCPLSDEVVCVHSHSGRAHQSSSATHEFSDAG